MRHHLLPTAKQAPRVRRRSNLSLRLKKTTMNQCPTCMVESSILEKDRSFLRAQAVPGSQLSSLSFQHYGESLTCKSINRTDPFEYRNFSLFGVYGWLFLILWTATFINTLRVLYLCAVTEPGIIPRVQSRKINYDIPHRVQYKSPEKVTEEFEERVGVLQ